jgi:hypothetical protein
MLAPPPPPPAEPPPLRLIGPVATGSYLIVKGQNHIALVTADDVGRAAAAENAMLFFRARERRDLLQTILAELQKDDEGERWPDLIGLIQEELSK